ncbi:hypothetical protein V8B97DRAFT_2047973 [Scleroderma yunnanense]
MNMPMLYGEGKRAFQHLQLEIICMSDDQSIFAWGATHFRDGGQTGSILADNPSFFQDCGKMESMDHDKFIKEVMKGRIPKEVLPSVEDCFCVFPVTNCSIQTWMLLIPLDNSDSVFEAWLQCSDWYGVVWINLVLWDSNYYRYGMGYKGYPTKALHNPVKSTSDIKTCCIPMSHSKLMTVQPSTMVSPAAPYTKTRLKTKAEMMETH